MTIVSISSCLHAISKRQSHYPLSPLSHIRNTPNKVQIVKRTKAGLEEEIRNRETWLQDLSAQPDVNPTREALFTAFIQEANKIFKHRHSSSPLMHIEVLGIHPDYYKDHDRHRRRHLVSLVRWAMSKAEEDGVVAVAVVDVMTSIVLIDLGFDIVMHKCLNAGNAGNRDCLVHCMALHYIPPSSLRRRKVATKSRLEAGKLIL